MEITKEYILENRTKGGSWTRSQIVSLGISWPPAGGWMQEVIGNELSEENRIIFESKSPAKNHTHSGKLQGALTGLLLFSDKELLSAFKMISKEIDRRSENEL